MVEEKFDVGESVLGDVVSPFWKAVFLVHLDFFSILGIACALSIPLGIFGGFENTLPLRLSGALARARRALLFDISLNTMVIAESKYTASYLLEQIHVLSEFEADTKFLRIREAQNIKIVAVFCLIIFWQGFLLAAALAGAILALDLVLYQRLVEPHLAQKFKLLQRVQANFLDVLRGADVVAMHNAETIESRALHSMEAPGVKIDRSTGRTMFRVMSFTIFLMGIMLPALLGFCWALFQRADDPRTIASELFALLAMLMIIDELHKSLNRLTMTAKSAVSYGQAALAADPHYKPMNADVDNATPADNEDTFVGPGDLTFSAVSVQYPDTTAPAVRDVCFTIPQGTAMAIVAESGAGKSTLFRAASSLIHHTGSIKFGNVELNGATKHAIRARMGFVSQDSELFARSIRDNIWFGNTGVPNDEKIWSVMTALGLAVWAQGLAQGLDTVLASEKMVSGGQAQRLQIARLLCRENVHFVLLDECMSALDPLMRSAVTKELKTFLEDKTTLVVTHSHDTIADLCQSVLDIGKLQRGIANALLDTPTFLENLSSSSREVSLS
ncbi:ABC transporter, putative [Hondaea fermentalgiana]|uniref:ABC transporter, putative n=1 Tax=Hondaea fermentalgiana TaxID=2315210 RepID=A0A2R5GTH6_9STRA|nr:ABC transporter, putative [Hondaea fermentalgiana]|eukprot:GBG31691.1 ABC transporter, putative [Hondaea fermentalgiana]